MSDPMICVEIHGNSERTRMLDCKLCRLLPSVLQPFFLWFWEARSALTFYWALFLLY